MRKNKTQATDSPVASDEPPFDRGFWSGKKGSAIGLASSGSPDSYSDRRNNEPVFSNAASFANKINEVDDKQPSSYPADLRRDGPFAKDKVVAPKATIDPQNNPQSNPQASMFQTNGSVRTVGSKTQTAQKRILQLDDFEPQTKAWRRTQKEPVAPRVHPNPTPVTPEKVAKSKLKKAKAAPSTTSGKFTASTHGTSTFTPPHASTDKPSIVMPLAMIFTLIVLIGGGYVYLSNLSEQNSQASNLASRERQVKLVETMLLNLDYKPGIIDGKIDTSLTSAVRAFQRDSLLEEDGLITPELITELEAILKIYESS